MKLKPFDYETPEIQVNNEYETDVDNAVAEVLTSSGVELKLNDTLSPNERLRSAFDAIEGGSLEDVAQNVVNLMCRGETETSRLKAAEFIAKIHEVKFQLEDSQIQPKEVVINIVNEGNDNKTLVQFMRPRE